MTTLSPEERHRIYEEEKARLAAEQGAPPPPERDSTLDLKPGTASLLCYLGGWITGIIFLILEQKNRLVRFHAAQSIIVFGFLQIAGLLLRQVPVIGGFLGTSVGILAFILWIILMVKASQGYFNLPPAGDLAEKMLGTTSGPTQGTPPDASQGTTPPPPPPPASYAQAQPVKTPHRADGSRAGRITVSAFAIAFSIAMLIFLNFFHDYIAFYHQETAAGVSAWIREPLLTADFSAWLPIANTALICGIAGHALCLAIDKYIMREGTLLILDIFSVVSVTALLVIFPFDFSPIGQIWATPLDLSVRITLAIIIFAICIGILVRLIKILVNGIRGTATY